MMKNVKVIIVMPLAEQRGGGELALIQLIRQGRDLGVEWSVVFLEDGPMVGLIRSFGVSAEVIVSGRLRHFHRYFSAVSRLTSLLRTEKYDLLIGWMGQAELYGGVAAKLASVPSLWYQINTPDANNLLDRVAMMLTDLGVLTNSMRCRDLQKKIFPDKSVGVVYHGYDSDRYDPEKLPTLVEAREELGLPQSVPIIGIVGRLQRWKGMHTVIRAMPKILEELPETLCLIIGGRHELEAGYEPYLQNLIQELGLGDRVFMAGLQKNIPVWISAMDVAIHASDREPFGIVILEAMALSKPTIAGSEGGPREILTDGENGLLVPFEDHEKMAEAVLSYLKNPELAAKLGVNARLRAADFTDRKFAVNFVNEVRRLAAQAEGKFA